jgi:hypothetical protein
MTKLQHIESEIAGLSAEELAAFRRWFYEFDSDDWDKQIEADYRAGKLDKLIQEGLDDYEAGRCTPL